MPPNKRQHYVPKLYLRNFAEDGDIIYSYNFDSNKCNPVSINSICQESYFYGQNLEIESQLSQFEGKIAKLYTKILSEKTVKNLNKEELHDLLFSITLQKDRTRNKRDDGIDLWEYLWVNKYSQFILPLLKSHNLDLDQANKEILDHSENLWIFDIIEADIDYPLISDLDIFIVENLSDINYIIGENPVVLNNNFSLYREYSSGLQSPGLQIWFPFHPKLALLFIDSDSYEYSPTNQDLIQLSKRIDIEKINLLQLFSTGNNLFFSDKSYCPDLIKFVHENKELKPEKVREEKILKKIKIRDKDAQIIAVRLKGYDFNVKFSFLKINHAINRKLKKYQKDLVLFSKNPPIRNPRLMSIVDDRDNMVYGDTPFAKGRKMSQIIERTIGG